MGIEELQSSATPQFRWPLKLGGQGKMGYVM